MDVPQTLLGHFDFVALDPPFLAEECLSKVTIYSSSESLIIPHCTHTTPPNHTTPHHTTPSHHTTQQYNPRYSTRLHFSPFHSTLHTSLIGQSLHHTHIAVAGNRDGQGPAEAQRQADDFDGQRHGPHHHQTGAQHTRMCFRTTAQPKTGQRVLVLHQLQIRFVGCETINKDLIINELIRTHRRPKKQNIRFFLNC